MVNIEESRCWSGRLESRRSILVFPKRFSKWKNKVQTSFWSFRMRLSQSDRGLVHVLIGCDPWSSPCDFVRTVCCFAFCEDELNDDLSDRIA